MSLLNTKYCVYYSHGGAWEPKITLICLINRVIINLITLIPKAFLFVNEDDHLVLVLLCKANLECQKICASDWLKPTSMLLMHIHFGFLCFTFQVWFCLTRSLFAVQA